MIRKLSNTILLLLSNLVIQAQTIIGNQTAVKLKVSTSGATQYSLVSLPENYDKETSKYPLIIFLHGISEIGSTETDLKKLITQGLPNIISKGTKIQAVNPVDKKLYKFIVISPQHWSWTTTPEVIAFLLKDLRTKYRIDTTRIYITGLSSGGQGVIQSVTYSQSLTNSIAAIVPMSPAAPNTDFLKNFSFFKQAKTGAWFFSGLSDTGPYTVNTRMYNDSINKYTNGRSKATYYPGGHCCWVTYYDPAYKENNMNIYEYMLQFRSDSSFIIEPPIIVKPPVTPIDTTAGNVSYKYYEGSYTKIPDFNSIKLYKSGSLKNFKIEIARIKDNFSILFEGYIKIDSTGIYTFGTNSDDGSKLIIDSTIVVDNDGLHSLTYKESSIKLTKGIHKISVQYLESTGDEKLEVYWKPIGALNKELIPNTVLVPKPNIPIPIVPKEVGRFRFIDIEIILYDNLTWEYSEIMNLTSDK